MSKGNGSVIITGVLGQDGSYLAEHLVGSGYEVYGVYRRISSGTNFEIVDSIRGNSKFHLMEGDVCDYPFMNSLIGDVKPDKFFSLAAQSHVGLSFKIPLETFRVDAEAVMAQLEGIRKNSSHTRFYFAGTSELWGGMGCPTTGFTEESPFYPRSPYAVAKAAAFYATRNYREA